MTEIFTVLQSVKAIWCYDCPIVPLLWNVQDTRLVSSRLVSPHLASVIEHLQADIAAVEHWTIMWNSLPFRN
jgi:hypothetical protein